MGSIVTFTGMNGAGKSTVLTNLACALARYDALVGCFSTDLTYASLPRFFAVDIPHERSLGKLFLMENPERSFVESSPKTNVFLSGIAEYENCFAHEPPPIANMEAFLQKLRSAFDFLLVEAGAPVMNVLSAVAINRADRLVNVIPCNAQGRTHDAACYDLLRLYNPTVRATNVLNLAGDVLDRKSFTDKLPHEISVYLPTSRAVRESESVGSPIFLSHEKDRGAREYCAGIHQLEKLLTEGDCGV